MVNDRHLTNSVKGIRCKNGTTALATGYDGYKVIFKILPNLMSSA